MTDNARPWAFLRPQGSANCPFLPSGTARPVPVSLDVSKVGRSARSSDCHLQFATNCSEVSGVHFKIHKHENPPDQFVTCLDGAASEPAGYITDLSTNGTFVDGEKLEKDKVYLVRNRCVISLAETPARSGVAHHPVYMFELANETEEPVQVPDPTCVKSQPPDAQPPKEGTAPLPSPDPPEPPHPRDVATTDEMNAQREELEGSEKVVRPARSTTPGKVSRRSEGSEGTHLDLPEAGMDHLSLLRCATKLKSKNDKLRRQLTASQQESETMLRELENSHAKGMADLAQQHKDRMIAEKAKFQGSSKEAEEAMDKLRKALRAAETQALCQEERTKAAEQSLVESQDALESLKEKTDELRKQALQAQQQLKTEQEKAAERVACMRDEICTVKLKADDLDSEVQKRDKQNGDLRQKLHEERSLGASVKQQVLELKASLQKEVEEGDAVRAKLSDMKKKMSEALQLNAELDRDRQKSKEEAASVRAQLREGVEAQRLAEDRAKAAQEQSALLTAEYKSTRDAFEHVQRSMANLDRRFRASNDILFTESLDQDQSAEDASPATNSRQLLHATASPVSSASRRCVRDSPTGDEPESKRARSSSRAAVEQAGFPAVSPLNTECAFFSDSHPTQEIGKVSSQDVRSSRDTKQETGRDGFANNSINELETMTMDPASIMDADTQVLIPGRDYDTNSNFDAEETEEREEGGGATVDTKSNIKRSTSPAGEAEKRQNKTVEDQDAPKVTTQDLQDFEEATKLLVAGHVPSAIADSPSKPTNQQTHANTSQNSPDEEGAHEAAPATLGATTAFGLHDALDMETKKCSEYPSMTLGDTQEAGIDQPCANLTQQDEDLETCDERANEAQDDRREPERAAEYGADVPDTGATPGSKNARPSKDQPVWNLTQSDVETCQEDAADDAAGDLQNLEKGAFRPAPSRSPSADESVDQDSQEEREVAGEEASDAPMHQDLSCDTPGEGDSLSSKEFSEGSAKGMPASLRQPEPLQSWGARWVD